MRLTPARPSDRCAIRSVHSPRGATIQAAMSAGGRCTTTCRLGTIWEARALITRWLRLVLHFTTSISEFRQVLGEKREWPTLAGMIERHACERDETAAGDRPKPTMLSFACCAKHGLLVDHEGFPIG